ncbi:glutathione S-transferase, amino-terminal domain protein [Rhizoctonia solani 123E]|uniref:Glutathione S-transferase, amino-terminal domain protein n=1 Tax=Rhizoctonia solani 123E TaxID=1423351 RepID=A0A074RVG5_9AGAM|nr:glutathione S-transferase, amino-terminal domain protein [Rhizoctonia solani 123E]
MASIRETHIIFYDLINARGVSWSPNTYKTRLCLEYKGLAYRTEYLALPDIEAKMKELGVPPIKETSPQYTLPDYSDNPNGKPHYIGDSFEIAVYLDEKYPTPQYPSIFKSGTRSLEHLFIHQYLPIIARAGSAVVMPKVAHILDKESIEYIKRTRGVSFEPLPVEETEEKWKAFRQKFFDVGKSLDYRDEDGPFITGSEPSIADFAMGGWFHLLEQIDPTELEKILEWHDGRWRVFWKYIQDIEHRSSRLTSP